MLINLRKPPHEALMGACLPLAHNVPGGTIAGVQITLEDGQKPTLDVQMRRPGGGISLRRFKLEADGEGLHSWVEIPSEK